MSDPNVDSVVDEIIRKMNKENDPDDDYRRCKEQMWKEQVEQLQEARDALTAHTHGWGHIGPVGAWSNSFAPGSLTTSGSVTEGEAVALIRKP